MCFCQFQLFKLGLGSPWIHLTKATCPEIQYYTFESLYHKPIPSEHFVHIFVNIGNNFMKLGGVIGHHIKIKNRDLPWNPLISKGVRSH